MVLRTSTHQESSQLQRNWLILVDMLAADHNDRRKNGEQVGAKKRLKWGKSCIREGKRSGGLRNRTEKN